MSTNRTRPFNPQDVMMAFDQGGKPINENTTSGVRILGTNCHHLRFARSLARLVAGFVLELFEDFELTFTFNLAAGSQVGPSQLIVDISLVRLEPGRYLQA